MRWLGAGLLLLVALLILLVLWVDLEPGATPPPPEPVRTTAPTPAEHSPTPRKSRARPDEATPVPPDDPESPAETTITRPVHRILVRTAAGEPVAGYPLQLHRAEPAEGVRTYIGFPFSHTDGSLPVHLDPIDTGTGPPSARDLRTEDVHELVGDETVLTVDGGPSVEARFFDARSGETVAGGRIRMRGAELEILEGGELHRLRHTGLERGDWEPFVLETQAPDGWALVHQRPSGSGLQVGLGVNVIVVEVPVVPGVAASVSVRLPDGTAVPEAQLVGVFAPGGHSVLASLIQRRVLPNAVGGAAPRTSDEAGRIELPALIPTLRRKLAAAVSVAGRTYVSEQLRLGETDDRTPITFEVVVGSNAISGAGGQFGYEAPDFGTGRLTVAPKTGEESGDATLYVSVRKHDGSPMPFALVYVDGATATRTDTSGQARLVGLPTGTRRVVVSEPGFPLTTRTVELVDGAAESVEIIAEAPRRLRVTVVDEAGDPLPGAEVVLRAYGNLPFVQIEGDRQYLNALTDAQGRIELIGVPHQRADVDVRWGPMKKTVPMARNATELEVVLTHRDR